MSAEPLDLALPRQLQQLRGFRTTLVDWLEHAGVRGDDRDAIVLAVHEAVANGIEHSHDDGEVRVRAEIDEGAVTVAVTSPGPWKQPQPRLGRGNGLVLIRALTDAILEKGSTSSKIHMRRLLSAEAKERRSA